MGGVGSKRGGGCTGRWVACAGTHGRRGQCLARIGRHPGQNGRMLRAVLEPPRTARPHVHDDLAAAQHVGAGSQGQIQPRVVRHAPDVGDADLGDLDGRRGRRAAGLRAGSTRGGEVHPGTGNSRRAEAGAHARLPNSTRRKHCKAALGDPLDCSAPCPSPCPSLTRHLRMSISSAMASCVFGRGCAARASVGGSAGWADRWPGPAPSSSRRRRPHSCRRPLSLHPIARPTQRVIPPPHQLVVAQGMPHGVGLDPPCKHDQVPPHVGLALPIQRLAPPADCRAAPDTPTGLLAGGPACRQTDQRTSPHESHR